MVSAKSPVNFHEDGTPISGEEVCELIAKESKGVCMLAYSAGKDSRAAFARLRHYFDTIIPFYMYRVPKLPYVERILTEDEQFWGTKIYRVPNKDLFQMLKNWGYQPPHRVKVLEAAEFFVPSTDDLTNLLKAHVQLPPETFCAVGVRAVDNIERGMAVRAHGPINWARRTFWPIHDLKKADLLALYEAEGLWLTKEYEWFGHSLGGMDYRYIGALEQHSPEDWQVILDWFPMAWAELVRYRNLKNQSDYPQTETRPIPAFQHNSKGGYQPTIADIKSFKLEKDPLQDLKYSNNLEVDEPREWEAILAALKEVDKRNHNGKQYYRTIDMPHSIPVIFKSTAQKDTFLTAFDWIHAGNYVIDGTYLMDNMTTENIKVNPLKAPVMIKKFVPPKPEKEPEEEKEEFTDETGIAERQKKDSARFDLAVSLGYWFYITFRSEKQRQDFLKQMGWTLHEPGYVDGIEAATLYGIKLDDVHLANKETRKDAKYIALMR